MAATPSSAGSAMGAFRTVSAGGPPGNWTHPRFDEIHRRLDATTFKERNIRNIVWNGAALTVLWSLPGILSLWPLSILQIDTNQPGLRYTVWTAQIVAIINISIALLPLIRHKDNLADIPLTPRQRALLGLPQVNQPATPGSHYITPPRYTRSTTPRSSRSGSPYSESPASGSGLSGTYSPSAPAASPLFHKAVGREARRFSPLGQNKMADQSTSSLLSASPSPLPSKPPGIALNSRWLYEKGRMSPPSRGYA